MLVALVLGYKYIGNPLEAQIQLFLYCNTCRGQSKLSSTSNLSMLKTQKIDWHIVLWINFAKCAPQKVNEDCLKGVGSLSLAALAS